MGIHWRREGERYKEPSLSVGWVRGPAIALCWQRRRDGVHRRVSLRVRWKFWLYRPFASDQFPWVYRNLQMAHEDYTLPV